ncbi:MAG: protein kinase [Deltaproteobacteria bacterium]|nr:protein kinase [Deltaproteobacteria bacterium]
MSEGTPDGMEPPSRSAPSNVTRAPDLAVGATTNASVMSDEDQEGLESSSWYGTDDPDSEDDDLVGTTLSDTYAVSRILGEGGMGRVYEAQHTRIASKRFAVKALHPEFARRKDVIARFQREVEAAASITSPHVVGVYDVGETTDGRPYLVSELLEGQELGDYLDAVGRMPVGAAVRIVRQVCKALIAAHDKGVIHREIKPENVYLAGEPTAPIAKVLDFGISRLEGQAGNTLTKTGMVMGTPSYMAPEQARGMKVDHRTDIYATGAILYRALTGKMPFDRSDATATLAAVLTEEPERPRALAPDLPEHLEMIIQRAMARNQEERYQSIDELDVALAAYDEEPGEVTDITEVSMTGKRPRLTSAATLITADQERAVRGARPQLVVLSVAAIAALIGALIVVVGAVLRLLRSGAAPTVTATEALVVGLVVAVGLATPVALLVRHVQRNAWDNTAKVVEAVAGVRDPVLVGLAASGCLAVLLRLIETVVLRTPTGISWPVWDLAVPLVGVGAAAGTYFWRRLGSEQLRSMGNPAGTIMLALGGAAVIIVVVTLAAMRTIDSGEVVAEDDDGEDRTEQGSDDDDDPGTSASADSKGPRVRTVGTTPKPTQQSYQLYDELKTAVRKNNAKGALNLLDRILQIDANAGFDRDLRPSIMKLSQRAFILTGESKTRMIVMLTSGLGAAGPDIMFELMATAGGSRAAKYSERTLKDDDIRASATPGMRIAYDLRYAKSCKEAKKLFPRTIKEGDYRALRELKRLQSCRSGKRCCSGRDPDLKKTLAAMLARQ